MLERRPNLRGVAETHVLEGDGAAHRSQFLGVRAVSHIGRKIKVEEDAVEEGERPHDVDLQVTERPGRAGEPAGQHYDKTDYRADGGSSGQHQIATEE